MKVLYDSNHRETGWAFSATEGTKLGPQTDGISFTIEKHQPGRDSWPRLLFSGPHIDLSDYTHIVLEAESPEADPQSICVASRGNAEEFNGLATTLPARAIGKIALDISDGASQDQSKIDQIFLFQEEPLQTVTYVLKKITAIANPDYVSRRAALGRQIDQVQDKFKILKANATKPDNAATLRDIETQISGLLTAFQQRDVGYASTVQQKLLDAESRIARTSMDLRGQNLWIWSSPLGAALRDDTLPSTADDALQSINDTVCLNQYKAICINFSAATKPQNVKVELKAPPGQTNPFSLRPTFFSKARDGSRTADAIGVDQKQLELDIPAYQSQQIILWVDTKKPAVSTATYRANLEITSGETTGGTRSIPLSIKVADVRLADSLPLSISNWAYFYAGNTPATDGLEKETAANLRDYGFNTWCTHYSQTPYPVLDAKGAYIGMEPGAVQQLKKVLELLRGKPQESFIIWLGFHREDIREVLDKPGVLKGYLRDLHKLLDEYKVSPRNRYLMLWDEPKLPQLRESVHWMRKIRQADPSFKFFDDGSVVTEGKEFEEFLKLTDLWLPNWEQLYLTHPADAQHLYELDHPGLGFYRCLVGRKNRGVNIYEYYRLMGWYTMQHGFGSLCFWVHNAGTEDVWDGTKDGSSGATMVYSKDGQLLTSRRLELFREGLDDYRLAQAAFGAKGQLDARKYKLLQQICEEVASHPNDVTFADQKRVQLIELAVKK